MSETEVLWRKYKIEGDDASREKLILHYAYLAKYVVDRMNFRATAAVGRDDLLGYAIVGMIDAVEKFDADRGVKFETYAVCRIRGSVLDALKSLDWMPRSLRESGQALKKTMARLESELGYPPGDEETASAMGISTDELADLLQSVGHSAMLSLEELMFTGEDYTYDSGLGMSTGTGYDPVLSIELEERREILTRAVSELPEREKLVVSLYYKEGLTLKEIAEVLGVSESRVCQMHSKAVIRMQGKLARHEELMTSAA